MGGYSIVKDLLLAGISQQLPSGSL